jgi:hypothetical protein
MNNHMVFCWNHDVSESSSPGFLNSYKRCNVWSIGAMVRILGFRLSKVEDINYVPVYEGMGIVCNLSHI